MTSMKSMIKYLIVLLMGVVVIPSCTKDFQEDNANPDAITDVTPDLLLPGIIRTSVNEMVNQSWGIGNIVIQHTAKIQFVSEDRYTWGDRDGLWNNMYDNMRNVQLLIALSEQQNVPNYKAAALVMRAWMFSLLTDAYGDIPYTEALQGVNGVLQPAYDAQETVYDGILSDLEMANSLFDNSAGAIVGDIIYAGDLMKWKKLANSLRLRALMRVSNKRDVGANMQAILDNPATSPVFESNEDNGTMTYLTTAPNQFPLYTTRSGSFDEFRLSKTFDDKLKALDDPRIQRFAQPTDAGGVYAGVPNGLNEVDALAYNGGPNNISRVGDLFYQGSITNTGLNVAKGYIMAYPELQFILAEAVKKGLITSGTSAQAYYEEGVSSSFEYFQTTMPGDYLNRPGVAYNDANALELIGTQKWVALFFTGLEAWFDWRRTDYPKLTPGRDNVNSDRIPVRFAYPRSEQTLNPDSWSAAVASQGEDDYNTKVWWDE